MEAIRNSEIQNDELICPITYEIFRDPVIAKDGHVYEREAITRWIFQSGTSPLTREPLQIEHLQPDDHLRRLAAHRRNATVPYTTDLATVTLPPLRSVSSIDTQISPNVFNHAAANNRSCKPTCMEYSTIVVLGCFVTVVIVITVAITSKKPTPSTYRSHPIF